MQSRYRQCGHLSFRHHGNAHAAALAATAAAASLLLLLLPSHMSASVAAAAAAASQLLPLRRHLSASAAAAATISEQVLQLRPPICCSSRQLPASCSAAASQTPWHRHLIKEQWLLWKATCTELLKAVTPNAAAFMLQHLQQLPHAACATVNAAPCKQPRYPHLHAVVIRAAAACKSRHNKAGDKTPLPQRKHLTH